MMQKGPGEGYMAAKDEVLELKPRWKCKRFTFRGHHMGYAVVDPDDENRQWGRGPIARDAWGEALHCLKTGERPSLEKSW